MKKIVLIFLMGVFNIIQSYAQGKLVVIYADPSLNTSTYSLSTKLYDALQETDTRMLLYISNADKPLISNSIYDTKNIIDKLSKLKPIAPNYSKDIDSLNRLLNAEASLAGISERALDIKDDIHFFFFFDAEKCMQQNLIEKVAEKLLLTNRLMNKYGLLPSCKVRVYLSNTDNDAIKKYIRLLKEEKGYDIIEY